MGIRDRLGMSPEMIEFGRYAVVIKDVMTDPTISREKKRKTLHELTTNLTEKTLKNRKVAEQIMIIINMQEEECKKFENAESQVNGILSWLPKMAIHRDMLLKEVSKHRKRYGL